MRSVFSTRRVLRKRGCCRLSFVVSVSVALIGVGTLVRAQVAASPPKYEDTGPSVSVPCAQPVDFQHLNKFLKVRARINGGPAAEFTVDTGSTGIVVTADDVPNIDPAAPPGTLTYSSSGVRLHGVWTKATVTFPDARGGVATAVVPVLAVTSEECLGNAVNGDHCSPTDHPHTHMMGVGFGRGGGPGHPEKNPFLNLTQMQAGDMHRGYLIARDGITLGLSAKAVKSGYSWQKLKERPVSSETKAASATLKDWETATGSFRVGTQQAAAGTVLIDTGLTNMMLADPAGSSQGSVPDGTLITVALPGGDLQYSFRVGDAADPQTPRKVSWVRPTHGVSLNTGLRALAHFDYLFDSDAGWLALRPEDP